MKRQRAAGSNSHWFDLDKYKEVKNFSVLDWYQQLAVRFYVWQIMSRKNVSYLVPFQHDARAVFEVIRSNPILTADDGDDSSIWHVFVEEPDPAVKQISLDKFSDIIPQVAGSELVWKCIEDKVGETAALESEYSFEAFIELIRDNFSEKLKHAHDAVLAVDDLAPDYGIPPGVLHAEINLLHSDDEVLAGMRTWLTKMRSKYPRITQRHNKFTESEMRRWDEHKVLPYLDIRISELDEEVVYLQRDIAKKLFPNDDGIDADITEKLRKTTKPHAEALMTYDAINVLQGMSFSRK